MRVAIISQVTPAVEGYSQLLRALGHEPVGMLCVQTHSRYTGLGAHVDAIAGQLDVVVPSSRERVAPLLRALAPDLALCLGFPWKLTGEMLAVPRLGVVNSHPSLLPRYRGPFPVAWAIRNGETEIGMTFHWMDAELDTGAILSQESIPLGDEHTWDELTPKFVDVVGRLLPVALERAAAGDPGDPQDEAAAEYLSYFEPEYAEIDWTRPAADVARQVRAWRFAAIRDGEPGALADLDGERVRILRVSLEPGQGREVACGDGSVWVVESEPLPGD
jgi:methionyl-tRNA formyltransferase